MHSTDLCPGKGRKACLQYVSGQTGHYPLGRDPETLEPSSDTFLANSPSRELRPDSSPKTVPVGLKGCGDPPSQVPGGFHKLSGAPALRLGSGLGICPGIRGLGRTVATEDTAVDAPTWASRRNKDAWSSPRGPL